MAVPEVGALTAEPRFDRPTENPDSSPIQGACGEGVLSRARNAPGRGVHPTTVLSVERHYPGVVRVLEGVGNKAGPLVVGGHVMFVGVRRKAGVGGWRWPGDGDMDGGSNVS